MRSSGTGRGWGLNQAGDALAREDSKRDGHRNRHGRARLERPLCDRPFPGAHWVEIDTATDTHRMRRAVA